MSKKNEFSNLHGFYGPGPVSVADLYDLSGIWDIHKFFNARSIPAMFCSGKPEGVSKHPYIEVTLEEGYSKNEDEWPKMLKVVAKAPTDDVESNPPAYIVRNILFDKNDWLTILNIQRILAAMAYGIENLDKTPETIELRPVWEMVDIKNSVDKMIKEHFADIIDESIIKTMWIDIDTADEKSKINAFLFGVGSVLSDGKGYSSIKIDEMGRCVDIVIQKKFLDDDDVKSLIEKIEYWKKGLAKFDFKMELSKGKKVLEVEIWRLRCTASMDDEKGYLTRVK
ncbi:MAG: hypothetical protein PHY40_03900 [Patescibacteria group bacterium]|nr:hypothetical protein [Patescibacteria group bacterium]